MRGAVVGQLVVVALGSALLVGCGNVASTGGMDSGVGAGSAGTTASAGSVGAGGLGSGGLGSGGIVILTGSGGAAGGSPGGVPPGFAPPSG